MAEVTEVKTPPNNFSDPQLWFSSFERTFALGVPKAITDTCTKFNYIVSNLPPEATTVACSFAQRSERASVGTFSSASKDLSVNYFGIHHANNCRESRRSRRQSPRRNLGFVGIPESFRKGPRNVIHPAAIRKRIQRGVIVTAFSQPYISRHLFIKDISSNIDTGSDVSVLPVSISEKRKGNIIQQLSAANTSTINVDVHSIKLVSGESIFHDVLREFPEIVKPPSFSQEVKHNVKPLIETSGAPVFAKTIRLASDRLKIAKSEFQHMLNLGHIRPSKSNYASPLHIVPKKDSNDWIPVEDRVEAILKFPQPTTITQLRRFLGMLNYFRRFIRQAAHILAPLVNFLKGIKNKKRPKRNVKIKPEEVLEWMDEATTAFELAKQALAHATLLHHPMPNASLSIWVDASDFVVGGALAQYQENFPLEDVTLTCDVSTNVSRPFIHKDYRKIVLQHLHGLSHPGIAASTKLVFQRFVWPNIRRGFKAWVNSCHPCQRSKIHRHTKAPIGTFALTDARFPQIHVDFIGPFPPSNGQNYCLTVVDRFTRWMEVIPTADMSAETVCRVLLSVWISRFGCPTIITTDQANGLVERLHRHLKSAIQAHENSKWSEIIPIVLLGMRSAVKKDINATCAELSMELLSNCLLIFSPQTSLPAPAIKPLSHFYVGK
ncbi:transposon Tf2-9 polyprotein [Trichonephila clavipes]|nr:transposon Tf2-9 polyprotein [Trichonephila clavipes]